MTTSLRRAAGTLIKALGRDAPERRRGGSPIRLIERVCICPGSYARRAGCSPTDAVSHYRTQGWREGLNPHPLFDTAFVLTALGSSSRQDSDPFDLLSQSVANFAAAGSPVFDPEFYLAAHEDVRLSGANPYLHYLEHGSREGRQPNPFYGFMPFDTDPVTVFEKYESLDDLIDALDERQLLSPAGLSELGGFEISRAHRDYWLARRSGRYIWPFNPELALGPMTAIGLDDIARLRTTLARISDEETGR